MNNEAGLTPNKRRALSKELAQSFNVDLVPPECILACNAPTTPPARRLPTGTYALFASKVVADWPANNNNAAFEEYAPGSCAWKQDGGKKWAGDPPEYRTSLTTKESIKHLRCRVYRTPASPEESGWFVLDVEEVNPNLPGEEEDDGMMVEEPDFIGSILPTLSNLSVGTATPSDSEMTGYPGNEDAAFRNVLVRGKLLVLSDERTKQDIKAFEKTNGELLRSFLQLEPVEFTRDDDNHVGFLAQNVQRLFPKIVSTIELPSGDLRHSIDPMGMLAIMTLGIKDIHGLIQETRLNEDRLVRLLRMLLGGEKAPHLRLTEICGQDADQDEDDEEDDASSNGNSSSATSSSASRRNKPPIASSPSQMTVEEAAKQICADLNEPNVENVRVLVKQLSVEVGLRLRDEALADTSSDHTKGGKWFRLAKQALKEPRQIAESSSTSRRGKQRASQQKAVDDIGRKDSILVMPTGGGKTLVACMACEAALREHTTTSAPFALFICQNASLVVQQAERFYRDGPEEWRTQRSAIAMACGDETVQSIDPKTSKWTSWPAKCFLSKSNWTTVTSKVKVLFVTAGLLKNIVSDPDWTCPKELCMAIFDEVHHAREGNHSFVHVACVLSQSTHVQLLGLSASIVTGSTQPAELAHQFRILKGNLRNAQLVIAEEDEATTRELNPESVRADPSATELAISRGLFDLVIAVFNHCFEVGGMNLPCPVSPFDPNLAFGQKFFEWAGIEVSAAKRSGNKHLEASLDTLKRLVDLHLLVEDVGAIAARDLNLILFRLKSKFGGPECSELVNLVMEHALYGLSQHLGDPNLAPTKLDKLVELLRDVDPTQSAGGGMRKQTLVRVPTQRAVFWVTSYLNSNGIKSAPLVGRSAMKFAQVQDALKEFKAHRLQVLVGTSVTEEGLDLTECDLIVAFSVKRVLQTGTTLIQNNGRARKLHARFLVMCESSLDELHLEHLLDQVRAMEETIRLLRALK